MKTVICLGVLAALLAMAEAQKCKVSVTKDSDYDYEQYLKCMFPDYKPDRKHRER